MTSPPLNLPPAILISALVLAGLAAPLLALWVFGWFRGFASREPVLLRRPRPSVEVVAFEAPQRRGIQWTRARLVVRCRGARTASLRMLVDGEPYTDRGLCIQEVPDSGEVTWQWRVLRRVPAGSWPVVVTVDGDSGRTQRVLRLELDWPPQRRSRSRSSARAEAAATT